MQLVEGRLDLYLCLSPKAKVRGRVEGMKRKIISSNMRMKMEIETRMNKKMQREDR